LQSVFTIHTIACTYYLKNSADRMVGCLILLTMD